jgi:hypothetical protein
MISSDGAGMGVDHTDESPKTIVRFMEWRVLVKGEVWFEESCTSA